MNPHPHLLAALRRLDLLLHREILRLRARYELSLDEFRGLYVSDAQVDRLVDATLREDEADGDDVTDLTERAEALGRESDSLLTPDAPWSRLAVEFGLTTLQQDLLLLALAPELDLKYETLYAYLNNDVGRKWPTHDLALRLLGSNEESRWYVRRALVPEGTLFGCGLLREIDPPHTHASGLAAGFAATPLLVRCVLGLPRVEPRLARCLSTSFSDMDPEGLWLPREQRETLAHLAGLCAGSSGAPVLLFEGSPGSGRAEAAVYLCRELGLPLWKLDLDAARATTDPLPDLLSRLLLLQQLDHAGTYAAPLEALCDASGQRLPDARAIIATLLRLKPPLILACAPGTRWRELLGDTRFIHLPFRDPPRDERHRIWRAALAAGALSIPPAAEDALADRFALNAGQIRRAVAAAGDAHRLNGAAARPLAETLFHAARTESSQELEKLAAKANTPHGWDDLVLPAATSQRLREVATAIRHRHQVYERWGFGRRIATGKGLKVLFAGTSGTGKTMAAGVIARDIGVELYKIDLSGVVSKYIGETEKNLDRIFRAAQSSSAILFFDEADALFGKRSEVKDAHDRYANIEISYLLQKMEEHEGAVILATNLRRNIDEAFGRRMHYVIEFPLPDARLRERLWRGMFPATVPVGSDLDFRFLARQFDLAGGDIQNVALDAAFRAAANGGAVTMREVVGAVARQLAKRGRLPSLTEFKHYHSLIDLDA